MAVFNLDEFAALPVEERALALWEEGEFIKATKEMNGWSAFYTYSDFYVEVRNAGEPGGMVEIIPFLSGERLERLAQIVDLGKL